VSGGQPAAGCGHPGDDETILKSHSESSCATSSGALEISLRHRETGTGPEGNFGSLEEEVDRPEGNFKAVDGRLRARQGTKAHWKFRNAGRPEFGKRRASWSSPEHRATCVRAVKGNRESGTRGNLGRVNAGHRSTRRGVSTNGGRSRRRGRPSNRMPSEARPGEAPPSHAWRGLVVRSGPVSARYLSDARPRRCASGCAASAPGTGSWQRARRRRRRLPRSHRSRPFRGPRRSAISCVSALSASGRRC
jgi:hypothetical protein